MAPARPDGLLEVGRIGRPHGVRGEVYLDLSTDRVERAAVGARLWVGEWLVVVASRSVPNRFLVHFAGVDDRTAAERLVNRTVYAEPLDDDDALWVHELIGSRVVELDGTERGRCISVVANPAHDLLELDSGQLVPVAFVVSCRGGITEIDPPPGLFDLGAGS
jgi:16S rRNA processing protein RimM